MFVSTNPYIPVVHNIIQYSSNYFSIKKIKIYFPYTICVNFKRANKLSGFDIVIGNPPYGVSIKDVYRKNIEIELGKVPDYEIYYYFIELAKKLVKVGGGLCYIIPNTYLFNTYATTYRLNIFQTWGIKEILDCSRFPIFKTATVRNTINLWIKSISDEIGFRNTKGISSFQDFFIRPLKKISKDDLLKMNQNWGLAFSLDPAITKIILKISEDRTTVNSMFPDISQGLIAYDKYQGQSAEIINSRAYHYNSYHDGLKKWLWGEDIQKYSLKWNGKEYINYCDGIANPRKPFFFSKKRILVREITNPSINATITDKEYYNDPCIINILEGISYSLEILLAILNSKLMTFYHFNHSPKATKGAFPKILVSDIKGFPLPKDIKEESLIVSLVNKILLMKYNNPEENTYTLEKELDRLIYKLYDLTDEEINVIEMS